jgi:hypothetical protein
MDRQTGDLVSLTFLFEESMLKHTTFRKLDLSPSSGEGVGDLYHCPALETSSV